MCIMGKMFANIRSLSNILHHFNLYFFCRIIFNNNHYSVTYIIYELFLLIFPFDLLVMVDLYTFSICFSMFP